MDDLVRDPGREILQRALCQVEQSDEAAINNDRSNKPFQHHLVKARGANLTAMACP
jgi:hypothetical protein